MNFRPHENDFFFYFISVPYTIIDLQSPENLKYIPRAAKWNEVKNVFSSPENAKKKIHSNIYTMSVTDYLLTVRSSSMKDYTCHYGVST